MRDFRHSLSVCVSSKMYFYLFDKIPASNGGSREKLLLFDSEGWTSNPDDYFWFSDSVASPRNISGKCHIICI